MFLFKDSFFYFIFNFPLLLGNSFLLMAGWKILSDLRTLEPGICSVSSKILKWGDWGRLHHVLSVMSFSHPGVRFDWYSPKQPCLINICARRNATNIYIPKLLIHARQASIFLCIRKANVSPYSKQPSFSNCRFKKKCLNIKLIIYFV